MSSPLFQAVSGGSSTSTKSSRSKSSGSSVYKDLAGTGYKPVPAYVDTPAPPVSKASQVANNLVNATNAPKPDKPATQQGHGLLHDVVTYAKAFTTSPVTAARDIIHHQGIKDVNNGAIIVSRQPLSYTEPIKKSQAGSLPKGTTGQLDHTIPLEIGGTNDKKNLKLIPKSQDEANSNVENYLGAQLKANVINAQQAKQLMLDYKAGKITDSDVYKKASKGGMPKGKSLANKVVGAVERNVTEPIVNTGSKVANEFAALGAGGAGLTSYGVAKVTGNKKAAQHALDTASEVIKHFTTPGSGIGHQGGVVSGNETNPNGLSAKDYEKIAGTGAEIAAMGKLPELRFAKGEGLVKNALKTGTKTAVPGGLFQGGQSAAEGGSAKDVLENTAVGAAGGMTLGTLGSLGAKGASRAIDVLKTQAGKLRELKASNPHMPQIDEAIKNVDAKLADATKTEEKQRQIDVKTQEKTALTAQKEQVKNQAEAKKVSQQLDLIDAKAKDNGGKLSNVDKTKQRQLQERQVELTPSDSTTPLKQEALKYKNADDFIKSQEPTYHGSPTPLKKFNNNQGTFFTNDYYDATGFGGNPDHVYEGYLNFKKPLVIDAKGAKWDELNTKFGKTTREVVANAQKAGYDGVTFKNIIDNAMDDAEAGSPGTIHYAVRPGESFLNESQLKDLHKQAHAETKPPKLSTRKQTEMKPGGAEPVNVPIEQLKSESPVFAKSKLAASTEQKAIEKKLTTGFGDTPDYATVNVKDQARGALDLLKTDPERALRIALGHEKAPGDLHPESVYTAVENRAMKTGDIETLQRLGTESSLSHEASIMGQRIRLLGERDQSSATMQIRKLAQARKQAFEKRTGKKADAEVKSVTKAIDNEVAKRANKPVTRMDWSSFVESIKC